MTASATRPLPDHGTAARAKGRFYAGIKGCDCEPCKTALYRADKARRLDNQRGLSRTITPDATAAAIERLAAAGMTYKDIAKAANCSEASIHAVRHAVRPITANLANRIQAVRPATSPASMVPSLGAVRRIRALIAIGHAEAAIAKAADISVALTSEITGDRLDRVRAGIHDRIDAAYQQLRTRTPATSRGASRNRNRAVRAGWPTPDQWDGEIDNPDADPGQWIRSVADDRVDVAVLVENAEWLSAEHGLSWDQVADRLKVRRDTLHTYRGRIRERAAAAGGAA